MRHNVEQFLRWRVFIIYLVCIGHMAQALYYDLKKGGLMSTPLKYFGLLGMAMMVFFSSCKKSETGAFLSVRMTDAPAVYNEVNVDLQSVEVRVDDGSFVTLATQAGIYNLLDYTDGVDTLIASGQLPPGDMLSEIRLVLGANNTVVVDGVTFDLATPSAQQSGLKIKLDQSIAAGDIYNVVLDFDAEQSIVVEGNGSYSLKPVIKVVK